MKQILKIMANFALILNSVLWDFFLHFSLYQYLKIFWNLKYYFLAN